MTHFPKVEVTAWKLRQMFTHARVWDRAQGGEFDVVVRKERKAPIHQPQGTVTQLVHYIDKPTGRTVAIVHQYLRQDGTLGASGRPDPKYFRFLGIVYWCK